VFLTAEMNHESHPIAYQAATDLDVWILAPWKAAVLAVFAGLYRLTSKQFAVGVPLGLFAFGTVLTVWKIYSSVFAVRIMVQDRFLGTI